MKLNEWLERFDGSPVDLLEMTYIVNTHLDNDKGKKLANNLYEASEKFLKFLEEIGFEFG